MFAYFTLWLSNAAGPILVVRCKPSSQTRRVLVTDAPSFLFSIGLDGRPNTFPGRAIHHHRHDCHTGIRYRFVRQQWVLEVAQLMSCLPSNACSWLSTVFIYPASQAPRYHVGYKAAAGFALGSCLFTGLWWWTDTKSSVASGEEEEESRPSERSTL